MSSADRRRDDLVDALIEVERHSDGLNVSTLATLLLKGDPKRLCFDDLHRLEEEAYQRFLPVAPDTATAVDDFRELARFARSLWMAPWTDAERQALEDRRLARDLRTEAKGMGLPDRPEEIITSMRSRLESGRESDAERLARVAIRRAVDHAIDGTAEPAFTAVLARWRRKEAQPGLLESRDDPENRPTQSQRDAAIDDLHDACTAWAATLT